MRAARSLGMSRRQYFAEHGYSLGTAKRLLARLDNLKVVEYSEPHSN